MAEVVMVLQPPAFLPPTVLLVLDSGNLAVVATALLLPHLALDGVNVDLPLGLDNGKPVVGAMAERQHLHPQDPDGVVNLLQ